MAAAFIKSNPQQAAAVISKDLNIPEVVTRELISSDRLQLNVYWASKNQKAAQAVFKGGQDVGYLSAAPSKEVLYDPGT